jgi:hypothetical protein
MGDIQKIMSHEIERVDTSQRRLNSRLITSFLADLPSECSIPGYWETLADNTNDWAPVISAGPFWRDANKQIELWKKEYRREFQGLLYKGSALPNFIGKSADRIKEKTFDKLEKAIDLKSEIKRIFYQPVAVPLLEDLVRVRLETQFLDGVPFLAKKILSLAQQHDPSAQVEPKGKLSGYFAQHLTFKLPVHFRFNGKTMSCEVTCEVQIATSLATLVWENSHGLYEGTRVNFEKAEEWQWNPTDPRFLSRQLGHMIHLADGLFCNLRDSSKNVISK